MRSLWNGVTVKWYQDPYWYQCGLGCTCNWVEALRSLWKIASRSWAQTQTKCSTPKYRLKGGIFKPSKGNRPSIDWLGLELESIGSRVIHFPTCRVNTNEEGEWFALSWEAGMRHLPWPVAGSRKPWTMSQNWTPLLSCTPSYPKFEMNLPSTRIWMFNPSIPSQSCLSKKICTSRIKRMSIGGK